MYIAAPEYIWTIVAAILVAIFMLLIQKWYYNGKIYRIKEVERKAIVVCCHKITNSLNDILSNKNTTNKKEEDSDEEDDDSDLDDIVDDFLK